MSAIPKDDLIRLRHMLDAAGKARRFVQGRERSDLELDEMLSLAIVRRLEIVGEAATHVSEPVQAALAGIPVATNHRRTKPADSRLLRH
jgi:uncharacterized protein with HEPN domain